MNKKRYKIFYIEIEICSAARKRKSEEKTVGGREKEREKETVKDREKEM